MNLEDTIPISGSMIDEQACREKENENEGDIDRLNHELQQLHHQHAQHKLNEEDECQEQKISISMGHEEASHHCRMPVNRKMLRFGTLNLNNRERNADKFVDFLLPYQLDVIVLNECNSHLAKKMDYRLRKKGYTLENSMTNAIFTRLPIKNVKRVNARSSGCRGLRTAVIIDTEVIIDEIGTKVEFEIIGTHISHRHEVDRVEQMKIIRENVTKPHFIMGDLNALYRSDYNDREWKVIADIRDRNRWMIPESKLMNHLLQQVNYKDSLEEATKNSNALLPAESEAGRPASTCRFDTRIDWILLPSDSSLQSQGVKFTCASLHDGGYRVIPTTLTDHNLVISSIVVERI